MCRTLCPGTVSHWIHIFIYISLLSVCRTSCPPTVSHWIYIFIYISLLSVCRTSCPPTVSLWTCWTGSSSSAPSHTARRRWWVPRKNPMLPVIKLLFLFRLNLLMSVFYLRLTRFNPNIVLCSGSDHQTASGNRGSAGGRDGAQYTRTDRHQGQPQICCTGK